jgi:hypothetical protein
MQKQLKEHVTCTTKAITKKMRDDANMFSKEKYFNGQQNTRNIEDNWKMI